MADQFRNKYRVPSARAQWWDYGRNAAYFVTICTHGRQHFFGDVTDGEMCMSEIGQMAHDCWHRIGDHFPFVRSDAFAVMPDHVHGIIIIDDTDAIHRVSTGADDAIAGAEPIGDAESKGDAMNRVSTGGVTGVRNPMLHQNQSTIVRWYKGRVSFEARAIYADFSWQSRFHDHIIRNGKEHEKIRNYILNNPLLWNKDKFNPSNQ